MIKRLLLIIISLIAYGQLLSQNDYYYSANKKIFMANTENRYVIGISDSSDFITLSKVAKNITPLFPQSYIITLKDTIVAKQTLNHFYRRKIPVKTIGDVEIIFTGEVLLKPKTEYGIQPIIAFSNGILSIKEYTAYNTYVMNVSNWDSLFYISNKVYESGMVEYCHPNFIVPVDLNYDPLYESQYYLNNPNNIDINAPDAWLLANNATNIKIAVIDEGVEEHEDLVNKVLPGMTVSYSNDRPNTYGHPCSVSQPTSWLNSSVFAHGEACAGIIAADHNNNKGIKGVINNAQIVPINIFNNWYMEVSPPQYFFYIKYRETVNDLANAINAAWNTFGCDVLNNSWTFHATDYSNIPYADNLIDAIHNATTYGRNGKGSIVVFSSGNDNQVYSGVSFPANVTGVIAVGAINANTGIVQNYSGRGPELSLVAPSGTNSNDLVTCDRMGSLGYNTENNGHYTNEFGGTSAACPQVSGVAALMLSVNPNLTSQEVTTILQTTARDLGTPGFDNTYGYGLIDAHKAVVHAMEYGHGFIIGPENLSGCGIGTYSCDFSHPDIFTYTWTTTSNLSITSNNGSSITVMPSSIGTGVLTVEVRQQGRLMYTLTKTINISSVWTGITPVATAPFHITSNTMWSSETFLPVTAIVDQDATLTVTDDVLCGTYARIIVRPGGKLVVDGGTLTSACAGEMWQGIILEGHTSLPQTAACQGTVQLLNGATIENALCGILTCNPADSLHTTGGIITADSATFRNCAKAVDYLPFVAHNNIGYVTDNWGSFNNCTFTVDDNNLFAANNTDFLAHVTMWDVKGVRFTRCRFEDVRTQSHTRKSAINTIDAGFKVRTSCDYIMPNPDCNCYLTTNTYCSFTGFNTAINATTSGRPYAVIIDGARFSNNVKGVRISGNSHAEVTRCTFNLTDPDLYSIVGLALDSCTGYLVEENTFTRNIRAPESVRYGITVNKSDTDANSLYRNTFERLSRGIFVSGTNGNGGNTGLQMTCNSFSDCTYDMYLSKNAMVAIWQGGNTKGADNTFSGTQTSSFHNAGSQPVTYIYSAGANHVPYAPTVSNVALSGNAVSNPCYSTICGITPMVPDTLSPKSPTPGFLSLKEQYENLQADYSRNGYADVLEHADDNTYDAATVAAAENSAQQINAIATELYAQSHAAVRALISDTLEDVQAVHAWLDATPGLASRYLAAETGFVAGADAVETHGRASLQDIAAHLTTAAERAEYDNYVAFQALKDALSYGNGHVAWPRATDAQVGELVRIADANTGRSSLLAKNVLCFFFGICYDDDMETRALATTTIPPQAEPPALTGQQNVIVHPNPTDNVLHVSVTDGEIARIEMFDAFGRVIPVETHGCASLPSPTTTVNTSDIPSGVYVLRVTLTEGTVRTTKIVKR